MSNHPLHKLKASPENLFEPGMNLEPSDQVWEGIKAQLPKKKKRRVLVFWLLAGLLAMGGAVGALLLRNVTHHNQILLSSPVKNNSPFIDENEHLESNIDNGVKKTFVSAISNNDGTIFSTHNKLRKDPKHSTSNGHIDQSATSISATSAPIKAQGIQPEPSILANRVVNEVEGRDKFSDLASIKAINIYPTLPAVVPKCALPILTIDPIQNRRESKTWMSLHYAFSPFNQNKALSQNEPLSELIVGSYYNQWQNVGVDLYFKVQGKWSAFLKPSVIRENLVTDYDLSIPYDYNSEKHFGTYNENYFTHSLPTDLGNIRTNLVVTRSSDSPVGHNELISLDFRSKQSLTYLSLPLGVAFGNGQSNKGLTAALAFVPEYLVQRSVNVDLIHSNHTFVSPKEVKLSSEMSRSSWHMGLGLSVEYRLPVYRNWSLQVQGNYNHYLTQTGRNNLYRFQLGLGRLF